MTHDQIEKHISELKQVLLVNVRTYPAGGDDAQLNDWRSHHDHFINDIKRLEFLLTTMPPRVATFSHGPLPF